MTSGIATTHDRRRRSVFPALVAVAGAALAVVPRPAQADLPAPWEVHQEVREHVHDVLRHLVRIPERIHAHHREHLEVFFGGTEYYGPHRHHHRVYRYPVRVGHEVFYRPYAYCGDHLFTTVAVRPLFWTDWGYPTHGSYCDHHHAYYPKAHSCFRGRGGHSVRPAPRRDHHPDRRYYRRGDPGHYGGRYDDRRDDGRFGGRWGGPDRDARYERHLPDARRDERRAVPRYDPRRDAPRVQGQRGNVRDEGERRRHDAKPGKGQGKGRGDEKSRDRDLDRHRN
jgi:hypothetical protein